MSFKFSFAAAVVVSIIALQVNSYDTQFGGFFNAAGFDQLSGFLSAKLQSLNRRTESPNYFDEYDFIIVGSGPGGCVLANRLTENADWNVLLIEAGNVETFIQNIPLAAAKSRLTQFDWSYKSEPQLDACLGMNGRRCALARGRGLGGSSVIDYMLYSRGHQSDYERWAAAGNNGWSYEDVRPYFLKSERSTLHYRSNVSRSHHNTGGDLNVEFNRFRTKIAESFVEANQFLGQREIDYNSGDNLGVSFAQSNTLNGMRHSAYRAFIEPILQRKNFHIMLDTRVTKIIIDPVSKSTKGVELVRNRKRRRVNIRKEVILSAGTFHSPQLLLLSGIGMKNDLKKHGIKAIHELPVGKMMTDHLCHFGVTFVLNTTGNSLSSNDFLNPIHLLNYLSGYGPLSTNGVGEALSFIRTSFASNPSGPDIEILSAAGSLHSDDNFKFRSLNIKEGIFENVYKPLLVNQVDTFTALIVLLHPKSTGFMELKNGNPFSAPLFYPNYLEHPDDVEAMLEGVKFVVKLLETPPFQKLGARLNPIPLPLCAQIEFGSDDYWRCSIRSLSSSFHDQVGTCKMGAINDYDSTTTPELKVDGISFLRVVDASVIPVSTSGHTNALSCMIGEKAADLIKNEWNKASEVNSNFDSDERSDNFLTSSERPTTTTTTRTTSKPATNSTTQNIFASTQPSTTESYFFDLFDNESDDGIESIAPPRGKTTTTKPFVFTTSSAPGSTTEDVTYPFDLEFDPNVNESNGTINSSLPNSQTTTTTQASAINDFDSIEKFLATNDPIERLTTKKTEVTTSKAVESEKVETTAAPKGNERGPSLEDDLITLLQNNLLTASLGGGNAVDPDAIRYPEDNVNRTTSVDEVASGELSEDDIRRRRFVRL